MTWVAKIPVPTPAKISTVVPANSAAHRAPVEGAGDTSLVPESLRTAFGTGATKS